MTVVQRDGTAQRGNECVNEGQDEEEIQCTQVLVSHTTTNVQLMNGLRNDG